MIDAMKIARKNFTRMIKVKKFVIVRLILHVKIALQQQ